MWSFWGDRPQVCWVCVNAANSSCHRCCWPTDRCMKNSYCGLAHRQRVMRPTHCNRHSSRIDFYTRLIDACIFSSFVKQPKLHPNCKSHGSANHWRYTTTLSHMFYLIHKNIRAFPLMPTLQNLRDLANCELASSCQISTRYPISLDLFTKFRKAIHLLANILPRLATHLMPTNYHTVSRRCDI